MIGTVLARSDCYVSLRSVCAFEAVMGEWLSKCDTDCAPLGFHWCLGVPIVDQSKLGPDGANQSNELVSKADLPRRVVSGGTTIMLEHIEIDTTLTRTDQFIERVIKRNTKNGNLVELLTTRTTFSHNGKPKIIDDRQYAFIARNHTKAPEAQTSGNQQATEAQHFSQEHVFDPVLLFRYSALNFNAHRIHYDREYCRDVEGLPDIVVQGPLQATLLWNLAVRRHGLNPPYQFSFRHLQPLFVSQHCKAIATGHSATSIELQIAPIGGLPCTRGKIDKEISPHWSATCVPTD